MISQFLTFSNVLIYLKKENVSTSTESPTITANCIEIPQEWSRPVPQPLPCTSEAKEDLETTDYCGNPLKLSHNDDVSIDVRKDMSERLNDDNIKTILYPLSIYSDIK